MDEGKLESMAAPPTAAQSALAAPSDRSLRVPCYCEENVWRLAYRKTRTDGTRSRYYVAFISNERKCVPMFQQVAADDPSRACCWDYHVILLQQTDGSEDETSTVVLDMDSRLPYPCPLAVYLRNSFPDELFDSTNPYAPCFRIIPAAAYLGNFSSDRMHMYDKLTAKWSAPPPEYACIQSKVEDPSNLSKYWDTATDRIQNRNDLAMWNEKDAAGSAYGVVLTTSQLQRCFRDHCLYTREALTNCIV